MSGCEGAGFWCGQQQRWLGLEGERSRLGHLEGQRFLALHCVVENSPVSEMNRSTVSSLYSLSTPLEARKVQGHCGKLLAKPT